MTMRPRSCACACTAVRWMRWACRSRKSEPGDGSRWICSSAMMDCRKWWGCRNSTGAAGRLSNSGDIKMGATALGERMKTAVRDKENVRWNFWTILLRPIKAGIAEIAAAKSSQQFGREEEKEK